MKTRRPGATAKDGVRPDFSEHKIDGEEIFRGKVFSAHMDRVRLPNGDESTREVIRHPGAAVILPLLDEETVLLEWQFRYPLGRHILELPAGKLEPGEDPRAAAERELLEETGYRAAEWSRLVSAETSPGFCDERAQIYVARQLHYEGHSGEADEFVAAEAVAIKDALTMIKTGEITDAKTILPLLWLAFFGA